MKKEMAKVTNLDPSLRVRDLVLNVGIAMLLGGGIDAAIFARSSSTDETAKGFPPSWFIATVWIVLFGLMGAARAMIRGNGTAYKTARLSIVALLLFCAAYPFYTDMFTSVRAELFGNVATIALALAVAHLCRPLSRRASVLILPTAFWVAFATVLTLRQIR